MNVIFLTLTPLLAVILVPWFCWTQGITWTQVIAATCLWMATGLGITAGYHRLFSHRAYKASAPVRLAFALLGGATWQNSIITWCAAHRYHHRDVDTDKDPYNARRGLVWSHLGWILVTGPRHEMLDNVPDLWKDPICRWQHRYYLPLSIAVNVVLVGLLGWVTGEWLGMILIAGLLRVVLVHHFTFTINSLAHYWGHQRWSSDNSSRDNWLLSFVSFGEGYHNYHHAFQTDYRNGPVWYNWDPSKWLIWLLAHSGLASHLQRTPTDVVLRKRFEERKAFLIDWLDTQKALFKSEHQEVLDSFQGRLQSAQIRVEGALDELRSTRRSLSAL
ncbi:MAG: fatty acid desaturase, partial [Myxococcota bacterium]|nr:fatty acid desaturase [Myxococcota bacterium]